MTLQKCYEKAGTFPFIAIDIGSREEYHIIAVHNEQFVDTALSSDRGEPYYWPPTTPDFILVDHFEQAPAQQAGHKVVWGSYNDVLPVQCKACSPYWTSCRCPKEKEAT